MSRHDLALAADARKTKAELLSDLAVLRNRLTELEAAERGEEKATPQETIQETRRIYKDLPVGLCYLDTDFKFIHINDWLAEINGIPAQEHLGRTIGELIPDVAAGVEAQFRQVIATGEPIIGGEVEAETPSQPGKIRHFRHSYYPVRSDDGEVIGVSCIVEDVTERKRIDKALQESEAKHDSVLDALPVLISYMDPEHRYRQVNKAYEDWFSRSRDWIHGRHVSDVLGETAYGVLREYMERALSGETVTFEAEIPYGSGGSRYVHAIYVPDFDEGEEVKGFFVAATDISDRRRAELELERAHENLESRVKERTAELEKANERLHQEIAQRVRAEEEARDRELYTRGITTNIADAVVTIDTRGDIQSFNPAAENMYGYTASDVLGKNVSILMPEPDHGKHDGYIQAYLETGEGKILGVGPREVSARRKDGQKFPMELTVGEMKLGDRRLFVGAMRDIGDRIQAEAALRESEARLKAIMDNAPVEIVLKDREGQYLWVNRAYETHFGKANDEIRGKTLGEAFPEADFAEVVATGLAHERAVLTGGEATQEEIRYPRPDRHHPVIETKFPIEDESGDVVGLGLISIDITELMVAEDQLRQAQKMEAVGQLTGGVAHDFNNLLTVILGNLELLNEQLGDDDELRSLAFAAQNAGLRGAELTRRLLAFSRTQSLDPKVIDLDRLVMDMSGLIRRTLGQAIKIQTVTNPGLWRTLADPAQLENALLNLALNARDAMPDGGKLTIEVANLGPGGKSGNSGPNLDPGDYVGLTVSDNGIGMSAEALARAVEPFFTTKEVGKGSGLGLSMVYGFARQSGGDLVIDSAPDQGTRVTIYLPKADVEDEAETAEVAAPSALPGGDETVLVVEDDADVRALAVRMLGDLGYEVIEADAGPAALELLGGEREVHLLFSDVLMPGGMSGWMLARRGRRIRPGLKVLLASGQPWDAVDDDNLLEQGVELLPKPYSLAELALKTRRALNGDMPAPDEGRRLLVVDDDPDIGDFVRRVAEGDGFEVKVTVAPEDFKQIYEAFRPTVIVMDIVMPEADGIELLRYLAEQGCRSRVVMMSGFNESYLRHAQSIGEGFGLAEVSSLAKPLRVEDLRNALQNPG